ncbi:hypothetical protein ANCDUO_00847 [Ancylostoma duodenale]|uniref:Uncharacterized protein n=1 Tax=Ancylostoma duodenale TaxID=51022 RepID=A0A0C2H4U1_9BILA|nr:hypothetical protein ANCDUO_00847 [Ancylostoma duodenale]
MESLFPQAQKVGGVLDKKTRVSVIQVCAPTADKDEADHANFYDEVRETAVKCRSYHKIRKLQRIRRPEETLRGFCRST